MDSKALFIDIRNFTAKRPSQTCELWNNISRRLREQKLEQKEFREKYFDLETFSCSEMVFKLFECLNVMKECWGKVDNIFRQRRRKFVGQCFSLDNFLILNKL